MTGPVPALRAGAAAGTAATALMSVEMLAAQRLGLMGRQPPARIATAALQRAGDQRPSRVAANALAVPLHFAFGGVGGAVYALALGRLRRRPDPVSGAVFGLLVWAGSYLGWVPWIGALPPPQRDRPGRPTAMILAHLVYGGALGALAGRWGGRQRRALRRV